MVDRPGRGGGRGGRHGDRRGGGGGGEPRPDVGATVDARDIQNVDIAGVINNWIIKDHDSFGFLRLAGRREELYCNREVLCSHLKPTDRTQKPDNSNKIYVKEIGPDTKKAGKFKALKVECFECAGKAAEPSGAPAIDAGRRAPGTAPAEPVAATPPVPARRRAVLPPFVSPPDAELPDKPKKLLDQDGADAAWASLHGTLGEDFAQSLRADFGFYSYESGIRTYGPTFAQYANETFATTFLEKLREATQSDPTIVDQINTHRIAIDQMALTNPLLVNFDIAGFDDAVRIVKAEQRAEQQRKERETKRLVDEDQRRIETEARTAETTRRAEEARVAAETRANEAKEAARLEAERKETEANNAWIAFGTAIGNPAAAVTLHDEFGFREYEHAVAADPRSAQAAGKIFREYFTTALSDDPSMAEALKAKGRAVLALKANNPYLKDLDTSFIPKLVADTARTGKDNKGKQPDMAVAERRADEAWTEFEKTTKIDSLTIQELREVLGFNLYADILKDQNYGSDNDRGKKADTAFKAVFSNKIKATGNIASVLINSLLELVILISRNPWLAGLDIEFIRKTAEKVVSEQSDKDRIEKNLESTWNALATGVAEAHKGNVAEKTAALEDLRKLKLLLDEFFHKLVGTQRRQADITAARHALMAAARDGRPGQTLNTQFVLKHMSLIREYLTANELTNGILNTPLILGLSSDNLRSQTFGDKDDVWSNIPIDNANKKLFDAAQRDYKANPVRQVFVTKLLTRYLNGEEVATADNLRAAIEPLRARPDQAAAIVQLEGFLPSLPFNNELAYVQIARDFVVAPEDKEFVLQQILPFLAAERSKKPAAAFRAALLAKRGALNPILVRMVEVMITDSALMSDAPPPAPDPASAAPTPRVVATPPPTTPAAPRFTPLAPVSASARPSVPTPVAKLITNPGGISRASASMGVPRDSGSRRTVETPTEISALTAGFYLLTLDTDPKLSNTGLSATDISKAIPGITIKPEDLKNLVLADYLEIKKTGILSTKSYVWGKRENELARKRDEKVSQFANLILLDTNPEETIITLVALCQDPTPFNQMFIQKLSACIISQKPGISGKEILATLDAATIAALKSAKIDVKKLEQIWPKESDLKTLFDIGELMETNIAPTGAKYKPLGNYLLLYSGNGANFDAYRTRIEDDIIKFAGSSVETYNIILAGERAIAARYGTTWLHTPEDKPVLPPEPPPTPFSNFLGNDSATGVFPVPPTSPAPWLPTPPKANVVATPNPNPRNTPDAHLNTIMADTSAPASAVRNPQPIELHRVAEPVPERDNNQETISDYDLINLHVNYLSYRDAHGPIIRGTNEEELQKLSELKPETRDSLKKYATVLKELLITRPTELVAAFTSIQEDYKKLTKAIGLRDKQLVGKSATWTYWDISKQLYYIAHPQDADPRYNIADPLTDLQTRTDISNRHLGWELRYWYTSTKERGEDTDEILKPFQDRDRETFEEMVQLLKSPATSSHKIAKNHGELSSLDLSRLGALIRKNLGLPLLVENSGVEETRAKPLELTKPPEYAGRDEQVVERLDEIAKLLAAEKADRRNVEEKEKGTSIIILEAWQDAVAACIEAAKRGDSAAKVKDIFIRELKKIEPSLSGEIQFLEEDGMLFGITPAYEISSEENRVVDKKARATDKRYHAIAVSTVDLDPSIVLLRKLFEINGEEPFYPGKLAFVSADLLRKNDDNLNVVLATGDNDEKIDQGVLQGGPTYARPRRDSLSNINIDVEEPETAPVIWTHPKPLTDTETKSPEAKSTDAWNKLERSIKNKERIGAILIWSLLADFRKNRERGETTSKALGLANEYVNDLDRTSYYAELPTRQEILDNENAIRQALKEDPYLEGLDFESILNAAVNTDNKTTKEIFEKITRNNTLSKQAQNELYDSIKNQARASAITSWSALREFQRQTGYGKTKEEALTEARRVATEQQTGKYREKMATRQEIRDNEAAIREVLRSDPYLEGLKFEEVLELALEA